MEIEKLRNVDRSINAVVLVVESPKSWRVANVLVKCVRMPGSMLFKYELFVLNKVERIVD